MRSILIWDSDAPPPAGDDTTVLWSGYGAGDRDDVVSLPRIVEQRADALRARYLAWIHDLGETVVGGRNVRQHLLLRPGFSYWWMTLLAHKPNYYDAAQITDVVKMFAFESLAREWPPFAAIRLHSGSPDLQAAFSGYCRTLHLELQVDPPPVPAGQGSDGGRGRWRKLAGALGPALRELGHAVRRGAPMTVDRKSAVCVLGPLIYLKETAFREGRFESNYWDRLAALLRQQGVHTTWLHSYSPHERLRSADEADALLKRFGQSSGGVEVHGLLDSQIGWRELATAVALYGRLVGAAWRMRRVGASFRPAGSAFDLWPLFKHNWYAALLGRAALRNCLTLASYEAVLKATPFQPTGLFLQENQPWEMALIHAWRAAGHGRLIGVPHTTVRFWDLRYFYDPRAYVRGTGTDLPMPDTVAVNGPMAFQAYADGGYPTAALAGVEALRFFHLLERPPARAPEGAPESRAPQVLVCGDNIPGSNDKVMRVVESAAACLPPATQYVFKPHRVGAFDPSRYPGVRLEVKDRALAEMLEACDIAVTGNITSAAADAYCRGTRVAVLLDGRSLNGSPLRGIRGVRHFATGRELAEIVQSPEPPPEAGRGLFWLDRDLPRWRQLLAVDSGAATSPTADEVRA